jgi:hypothetical protein
MEEKLINNIIRGYPFSFPFWKGPMDQNITLEEAKAMNAWKGIRGCAALKVEEFTALTQNVRKLFAIYASGKKNHPRWSEAKHAVRAFPHSYMRTMGITAPMKSWMPKLI